MNRHISKNTIKIILLDIVPILVTGILLIIFAFIKHTRFIKLLPALVSLFVMLLNVKVNRYTFLIGALNCLIYIVGFYMEGLYASITSSVLLDIPFQLASFFMWKKHSTNNDVQLQKLSLIKIIFIILSFTGLWIICYYIYRALGTQQLILDNTIFVVGIFTYILTIFRYIESKIFQNISVLISLIMWTRLTIINGENITYLISAIFNLYMCIRALISWIKKYKTQCKEGINYEQLSN